VPRLMLSHDLHCRDWTFRLSDAIARESVYLQLKGMAHFRQTCYPCQYLLPSERIGQSAPWELQRGQLTTDESGRQDVGFAFKTGHPATLCSGCDADRFAEVSASPGRSSRVASRAGPQGAPATEDRKRRGSLALGES
jgi:hypothetical protein